MNRETGRFIVFEGVDGSGKTTQSRLLADYFNRIENNTAILTKNQSNGVIGKLIEQVLIGEEKIDPISLRVCFIADRVDQTNTIIKPLLELDKIVISDRYSWSTAAYGYTLGLETMELILELDKKLGNLEPDLAILVDVDTETAMKRIALRGINPDIFEKREKIEKVREGYNILANRYNEKLIIVDGRKTVEEIHQTIIKEVKNRGFIK